MFGAKLLLASKLALSAVLISSTTLLIPTSHADSGAVVLMLGGTFVADIPAGRTSSYYMRYLLQGDLCKTNTCVELDYAASGGDLTSRNTTPMDQSEQQGLAVLDKAIKTTPGKKIVFAYSQGAEIVSMEKRNLLTDPEAPPANELSFVVIGNPGRPNGGIGARFPGVHVPLVGMTLQGAAPDTQYPTTDIARQYDGFADVPSDPKNMFALANMSAGMLHSHMDYLNVDINNSANMVSIQGNTTFITIPQDPPLIELLRSMNRELVDSVSGTLKERIERGYDRTVSPGATVSTWADISPMLSMFLPTALPLIRDYSVKVALSLIATLPKEAQSALPPVPESAPVLEQPPIGGTS